MQIPLDACRQTAQHPFPLVLSQEPQHFITADAVQHLPNHLRGRALAACQSAQDLCPAVAIFGVGVHHISRQLHQLADMPHQYGPLKVQLLADVDGIPNKIADLDRLLRIHPQAVFQKIAAVVAGGQQHRTSQEPFLPQLHPDGIHQGFFAHRLYNAGSSQNGDASQDAQPGVEGLFRQLLPQGHRDQHPKAAGIVQGAGDFPQVFLDHFPGHRIDGSLSNSLIQPWFRHPAHAEAPIDVHPPFRDQRHLCVNQRPGSDVRIVSPVLFYSTADAVLCPGNVMHRQLQIQPLGRVQADGAFLPARQEHPSRRLGRRRGAGAGGIAQAEFFPILLNKLFHGYLVI